MTERPNFSDQESDDKLNAEEISASPFGIRVFEIFMYAWPKELREEVGEDCLATDELILAEKYGLDKASYILRNSWGFIATGISMRLENLRNKK